MLPEPYYQDERCTLYHGDALDLLPYIRSIDVDAVVTDPPYGINTKSDGSGKINPWSDLCNASIWYAAWFKECRRLISDDGAMWSCLNWRSLVTFQKASCDVSWPIESLMVWDKKWIGPGGSRGLRPSYEMVALFCGPNFAIDDRGLPDIQAFPWSSHKPTGHPAEKPIELMRFCVNNSTKEGETVLDPFCGSGTTLVAAKAEGRRAIGIESDIDNCQLAANRLRQKVMF